MAAVFLTFTAGTNLRVKQLTGGSGGGAGLEAGLVRRGVGGAVHQLCDILVATPGRLTHAIRECPDLDLSHLRYLVIDEADRMMENIAQDWLNILEAAVYTGARRRPGQLTAIPLQKLLFSATLSHDPEQLEQLNLFEPKLYRCVVPAPSLAADPAQSLPSSLAQLYAVVAAADKPLAVHQLVTSIQLAMVLVFTHSNDTVHRLALVLTQLLAVKGQQEEGAGRPGPRHHPDAGLQRRGGGPGRRHLVRCPRLCEDLHPPGGQDCPGGHGRHSVREDAGEEFPEDAEGG